MILPGIWRAARDRQCSLASRRQVWCLLTAAIRPCGIAYWASLKCGASPAYIGYARGLSPGRALDTPVMDIVSY